MILDICLWLAFTGNLISMYFLHIKRQEYKKSIDIATSVIKHFDDAKKVLEEKYLTLSKECNDDFSALCNVCASNVLERQKKRQISASKDE